MTDAVRTPMVCYLLPNLTGGGAERVALNIMRGLPEAGRRLVLFENKMDYPCDAPLDVLHCVLTFRGFGPKRLYRALAGSVELLRLKHREGSACWLSFTTMANVLNVLTPVGGRVVVTSHNRESENLRGASAPLMRALVSFTYPRADLVVAVSESVKADLVERFGVPENKIVTIYNAVDLSEVATMQNETMDEPLLEVLARPSVVTVGRLIEQKGQWHLIRAFAALKKVISDASLVIVGKGELGTYLAQMARDLGLRVWAAWEGTPRESMARSDVVFSGFLANPFAVIARARVFAFPSLWEGFGNAILEALACGAPAVVADCRAGPREILAPGSGERTASEPEDADAGILMPVFDGEKRAFSVPPTATELVWAETLARVLPDGELRSRYADRGRRRAEAFSVDAIADEWRRVLFTRDASASSPSKRWEFRVPRRARPSKFLRHGPV